jgi:hypothetical protein
MGYPEPDTTTTTLKVATTELLSLTSGFTLTTDQDPSTFAAANILLGYESKKASLELARREKGKATIVPPPRASTPHLCRLLLRFVTPPTSSVTTAPSVTITITRHGTLASREAPVSHGSGFMMLSKETSDKITTGATKATTSATKATTGATNATTSATKVTTGATKVTADAATIT